MRRISPIILIIALFSGCDTTADRLNPATIGAACDLFPPAAVQKSLAFIEIDRLAGMTSQQQLDLFHRQCPDCPERFDCLTALVDQVYNLTNRKGG